MSHLLDAAAALDPQRARDLAANDAAEAAAREAEARRCAPLPACEGLLRLAPMR